MPQETNLNVSPYFDDFDRADNYYKVLFKPGYPIQARELTTSQSLLQNQVEQFGNHVFKEGAKVLGGNLSYNDNLTGVIVENSYLGVNVDDYLQYLPPVDSSGNAIIIRGATSGIRARLEYSISSKSSVIQRSTIYVTYLTSDTSTGTRSTFFDGEVLEVENPPTTIYEPEAPGPSIQPGQGIAITKSENCNIISSAIYLENGVYFARGYFIDVPQDFMLLDQYNNVSNYKVGFRVIESFVNAYEDPSLYDNAKGFTNYGAPGADRLKIQLVLDKIPIDRPVDTNFIVLKEIVNGQDITTRTSSEYNLLEQEFAKRTYDESGDYYVKSPIVSAKETLNDLLSNNGIFNSNQLTYNNNVPSEELGTYAISPLKAYVQGFGVETISTLYLDFPKPRTTKLLSGQSINYITGPTYTLNRVYGSPIVGLATNYTVSLRNSRVGTSQTSQVGKEIGIARVFDFALESGSYNTSNANLNQWDISLYDVQTYTEISLNQPITLTTPIHIKGKSSGAIGYLRFDASNSGILTAYNTKGKFSIGEKLIFDGVENSRISVAVTSFSTNDAKSLYGIVGSAYTFTADTIQKVNFNVGTVNITGINTVTGISTVRSTNTTFTGIATVGNLVSFTNPGNTVINFAKIETVSQNSLTISGVTTVSGICEGALPTSSINPTDFALLSSSLQSSEDNTLYTRLPNGFVSSVDLTDSNLTIKKQFDITITSNSTGTITAGADQTFLPFDEERYVLIRENGTTEDLNSSKFVFTSGSRELTINGLSGNGPAKLIATLRKINVKSKVKTRNRVKTIIVDKSKYVGSGIGSTTLNNGLTYGKYPYGTKVEDEEICLLYSDVTKLYGVFESNDNNDPELPSLIFSTLSGPTNKTGDLLFGEKIIGSTSKAVAIYCEKINDLKAGIIYLNNSSFIIGETVSFEESGIRGTISSIDRGDSNITSNFTFNPSQNETIYDYSRITRKQESKEPTKKIKVVFEYASFLNSDNGDITTANSYDQFDYCDIGTINGVRLTDIIDIRQKVSPYTVTEGSRSPFEFLSRSFDAVGNSAANVLASDESILLDYNFYLPRIDKVYLNKNATFQLALGEPSENPNPPVQIQDALEIATAVLPPYLCNVNDISISLAEHKRYRMSDIKGLENRIKNLEYYTALTLLEVDANSLQIKDANGLDRFKSGIFVDDFSTTLSQKKVTVVKNSIDIQNSELRPTHYTTQLDLLIGSRSLIGIGTTANPNVDLRYITDLDGNGIRKTGQLISLDYQEVIEINQIYSTRVQNVTPYALNYFPGTMELFPSSDVWVQQNRLKDNIIIVQGNYIETSFQLEKQGFDRQTGFGPVTWNSWSTVWSGETSKEYTKQTTSGYLVYEDTIKAITKTGTKSRTGSRQILKEQFDNQSFGDQVLSSIVIPYMRSRNIEFTAKRLKPLTRVYPFFDGVAMADYVIPKLLEVSMITGTFVVGETINIIDLSTSNSSLSIIGKFRVSKQNHKYGPYDAPLEVYTNNPYNSSVTISDTYSASSTLLNVDTYSLANTPQGAFYGYLKKGCKLIGATSGAEATLTDIRLVTDSSGTLIGCLHVTPGVAEVLNGYGPKFETGIKLLRLTSSSINSQIIGSYTTSAEEKFYAEGKINTVQENIISVRNSRIETQSTFESESISETSESVVGTKLIANNTPVYYGGGGGGGGELIYRGQENNGSTAIYAPGYQTAIGMAEINRAQDAGYSQASIISWIQNAQIVGSAANNWAMATSSAYVRDGGTRGVVAGPPPPAARPAPPPAPPPPPSSGGRGRSDVHLKRNIQSIDNPLNRLLNIKI